MGEQLTGRLPVLPLKNLVLYPNLMLPLSVGREGSRNAVEASLQHFGGEILLLTQRDPQVDQPGEADLYKVGTRAHIKKVLRNACGSL